MSDEYDDRKLRSDGADALIKASTLKVNDTETWYAAREVRRRAKLLDHVAEKHYKEVKAPINEMRRKILDMEDNDRAAFKQVFDLLDPQIISYEEQENLLRANLQSKLEADARRQAQQVRIAQIRQLNEAGEIKRALELEREPLYVPPVVVPPGNEMLDGEGRMETWEAEITDMRELCKAIVDGRVPQNVLVAGPALNGMARALRDSFEVPGVRAKRKRSITQR